MQKFVDMSIKEGLGLVEFIKRQLPNATKLHKLEPDLTGPNKGFFSSKAICRATNETRIARRTPDEMVHPRVAIQMLHCLSPEFAAAVNDVACRHISGDTTLVLETLEYRNKLLERQLELTSEKIDIKRRLIFLREADLRDQSKQMTEACDVISHQNNLVRRLDDAELELKRLDASLARLDVDKLVRDLASKVTELD